MTDLKDIFEYYIIEDGPSTLACQDKKFHVLEYVNNHWIVKPDCYISDYLYGFDPSEPEGSPYRIFNNSISRLIHKITKNEAETFIGAKIDENELLTMF